MVTDNEARKKKPDKLRLANEEKKKKLTEEHGAYFSEMSTFSVLPPEIESQFLDNIIAFEKAYESINRILLYDFLEKPFFRKIEEMSNEEIPEELDRLTGIMEKYQVSLDTICDVSEPELYRFITEELFLEEKDDVHIPGMISHFIYEDFHPNHEHDIRQNSYDFIRFYLNKEDDFYKHLLTSEAEKADWHLDFRKSFNAFQLNSFTITGINFDTEKATVQFEWDFKGIIEGSVESLHFFGAGVLNLSYQWEYWCIDSIKLPKNV